MKSVQRRRKDEAGKRDIFGRNSSNILSCLPTMKGIESIDVYSHDLENGYSPLHVTLKNGYLQKSYSLYRRWKDDMEFLSHKYGGHVLNQVDREGLKPLELYNMELQNQISQYPRYIGYGKEGSLIIHSYSDISNTPSSIKDSFMAIPKEAESHKVSAQKRGTHILTWGSNVNYQLGTGTKDDRKHMFQLGINQLCGGNSLPSTGTHFKKILMRRYHSMVVTSTNKIYTCGNGSRGRLGNGVTDSPQLNYTEILDLENVGISMIVSSNHHSLILTETAEIYSWGWNGYGQLGYASNNKATDEKLPEKICGSKPKRISFFDDKSITLVACSKVHSCAVSKNGTVYLWGLNLGQMGGPKPSHLYPATEYQGQDGYIVMPPIILNLSHLSIHQVVCTDFATFIRTSNNTLHVYSNYMTRTFKIPLPRARTFKEIDAFSHFAPREVPGEVLDMKCSNIFGNNICFRYSCGRIGMVSTKDESSRMWTKFPNSLPVALCWIPNYENRKCSDFAVSSTGSLLLSTFGGEVFTCTAANVTAEQIHSNKIVAGRSIEVSCDASFGSFAIIKSEKFEVPIIYPKDSLLHDFSQYSPLNGNSGSASDTMWGMANASSFTLTNYLFNSTSLRSDDDCIDTTKVQEEKFGVMPFVSGQRSEAKLIKHFDGAHYDVDIVDVSGGIICQCHKLILLARCPKLRQSLMTLGKFLTKDGCFQLSLKSKFNEIKWRIEVSSSHLPPESLFKSLKEVIHFLYTDEKRSGHSLSKLLFELMDNSYHLTKMSYCLHQLLKSGIDNKQIHSSTDVVLQLKDGELMAHSLILSTRCLFFQIALKREWRSINDNRMAVITMDHVDSAHMKFVMKYIYGFPYDEIFMDTEFSQDAEDVQFFLNILKLCDELNLECFKNYVESVTGRYITGETVVPILINAVNSNSRLLALKCCWFLCCHIGLLFTGDNIELIEQCFNADLWALLEGVLSEMKSRKSQLGRVSWYEDESIDWLNVFQTNTQEFNHFFMDSKAQFIPVFDLKFDDAEASKLNRKTNRRRSSAHSLSKSRQSSFASGEHSTTRRPSIALFVESKSSWKSSEALSDSEAVADMEEFIEVSKKTKRRTSNHASILEGKKPGMTLKAPLSKVVVHQTNETMNENLPSLLTTSRKAVSPAPSDISEHDSLNTKMTGSFKKESQKQRRKHLTEQEVKKEPKNDLENSKKTVWGINPPSTSVTSCNVSAGSSTSRKSLPSLYDNESTIELTQTKKEKKRMVWNNSTRTEFVSHGNLSGITPYVHKLSMATSGVSKTKASTNGIIPNNSLKPKLSLEERAAAKEFEKWFAQESEKVQKKLSNDKHKTRDGMKLMYNAAENLPDFITNANEQSSNSKRGKKLKLKFQAKHKKSDDTSIRTL